MSDQFSLPGIIKLRKRPAKRCGKTVTKVKPALHSSLTPKMLTPFSRWAQIPRETLTCGSNPRQSCPKIVCGITLLYQDHAAQLVTFRKLHVEDQDRAVCQRFCLRS